MKQLSAILFTAMILLQHGVKLWVIAEFEANREFIAEMLCVNKAVPEASCHGSCYLKARLNLVEQEEAPQENPHKRKTLQETVYYYPSFWDSLSISCLAQAPSGKWVLSSQLLDSQCFESGVFHPPTCFFV